jgi:hypothetical protein
MAENTDPVAVISIDYSPPDPKTYRAVVVSVNGQHKRFDGGMVEHDFPNAAKYAYDSAARTDIDPTCEQFIKDGWDFGWKQSQYGEVVYRLSPEEKARYTRHPR